MAKPPRLDRRDQVDRALDGGRKRIDRRGQAAAVEQQGGDVAELDARLGKVRDGADQRLELVIGAGHTLALGQLGDAGLLALARLRFALFAGSSAPFGATLRFASAQMLR